MSTVTSAKHLGTKPLHREIELDFIRGIAILMVVDFHTNGSPFRPLCLWLGYQDHIGVLGVDIFFVLSGFLVGGLLMKEWKVRRGVDGKRFLIRRGFKIWPQYYFYLAVMLLTGHRTVSFLWGNLLNIQNYVGGVAHTWSLAIEEHCYLLLTFCMVIAARRKVSVRGLFWFLLVVCALEIPFRYWLAAHNYRTFEPTHARLDSIGDGVLLAMLFHFAPEKFDRLRSLTWVGAWPDCRVDRLSWPFALALHRGPTARRRHSHRNLDVYPALPSYRSRSHAQRGLSGRRMDWGVLVRHLSVASIGRRADGSLLRAPCDHAALVIFHLRSSRGVSDRNRHHATL